jgi:[ribosomal protein S18]-alanine N-acetyltransferase
VIAEHEIALALPGDATRIATMSRDLIEHGLAWRWTPPRILRMIRDPATNVAVARCETGVTGFALMQYKDDEAHLLLLGVDPGQRRKGIGLALMRWLETTALTAGIGLIYLEARTRNTTARAFYRELGYVEIRTVRDLYSNDEDGVRIAKDLWEQP